MNLAESELPILLYTPTYNSLGQDRALFTAPQLNSQMMRELRLLRWHFWFSKPEY